MPGKFFVRADVDPKHPDEFIFQFHLIVPGVNLRGIQCVRRKRSRLSADGSARFDLHRLKVRFRQILAAMPARGGPHQVARNIAGLLGSTIHGSEPVVPVRQCMSFVR